MLMNKAVFLDRDGTINEEMGYINHISRFKMFEFVPEAIKIFNEAGYLVIIVTNQSGLAKGYFDEALLNKIHQYLLEQVKQKSAVIDKIYICPHHPAEGKGKYKLDCMCRKPKTGMIDSAKKEFNIDISKSFVIGDRHKDVQFGQNAGLKTIMLMTGYGKGEYTYQKGQWNSNPDYICENLLDAANLIKNGINK